MYNYNKLIIIYKKWRTKMKRKFEIALSVIFIIIIFIGVDIRPDFVTAAEIYDYSGFWNCGNAKISVDSGIYCCAFSGTTGYGGVVFPYGSSFTISCDYKIFASCAAGGRFYYFTQVSNEITDCNIVVYDSNSGLTDTFAVADISVSSNDMVAADSYGNIYFVNSNNGSLVKCFAMSGRPCAEISLGGSVLRLTTAGNGNVLAVCTNGNYLINSSGGCSYVGGGSDVFPSGNGYFSDNSGGVYNSSLNSVYGGGGMSACASSGYVVNNSGVLQRVDSSGKAYEQADCVDGVSKVFAIGDTIITFNGGGVFDVYTVNDFYKIQEETTAPTTQVVTEEITRPTETTQEDTEETEIESTDSESFVVSSVYTMDKERKYVLGVLPSTKEEEFIGNFSIKNAEYDLQRSNNTNQYISNGDVISFISENGTDTYRIVVNRDFNCDGKFNNDDIDAMAYLLLKGGSIHQWQQMAVDVNENGNVDLSDLYDSYLNR